MRRNVLNYVVTFNTTHKTMIIDIIIVVLLLLAFIFGMRQGLIAQICSLLAVIAAAVIAPSVAKPIGGMFTDSEILAFAIGFIIILICAILLVWLIAPILKKILVWDFLKKFNSIAGAVVGFISMLLLLSVGSTMLNTANIGDVDEAKVATLFDTCEDPDEMADKFEKILVKDPSMRDYYTPRFVEYQTLDDSFLFDCLIWIGDNICPDVAEMQDKVTTEIQGYALDYAMESVTDDGTR